MLTHVSLDTAQGGADDNAAQGGHLVAFVADQASTVQATGGGRGHRIDAESAAGGHLVATFQKVGRPHNADEPERWEPRDLAATLNLNDLKSDHRVADVVVGGTMVRRLTPTECERLQGFPDGHTSTSWGKPQADSPRYKQLGNAVAVPVFEWVARRIAAVAASLERAS